MEQLQLSSLTEESSQVLQEPSLKDFPQHLAARGPGNIHPNRVTGGKTSGREILWREWRNKVIPYPPAGEAMLVMGALGWKTSQLPVLVLAGPQCHWQSLPAACRQGCPGFDFPLWGMARDECVSFGTCHRESEMSPQGGKHRRESLADAVCLPCQGTGNILMGIFKQCPQRKH